MSKKTPEVDGNPHGDRGKAISPDKLRNKTAPRKTRDQPDDEPGYGRDPEREYAGDARKDH